MNRGWRCWLRELFSRSNNPPQSLLGKGGRKLFCLFVLGLAGSTQGQTETIRVDVKLRTGGALSGLVVDHSDHGLVVVHDKTPYVFSWGELEAGSAYAAKRRLRAHARGGDENLLAADFFELGLFSLRHGRADLASRAFGRATGLDASYKAKVRGVLDRNRRAPVPAEFDIPPKNDPAKNDPGVEESPDSRVDETAKLSQGLSAQHRDQVIEAYKTFGAKVQELIGKDVVLVESDHFLIWTDWERKYRDRLVEWCESMYAALCAQLGIDPDRQVFLSKCPIFCWRNKARFTKFARLFDGYPGTQAVGYTRSIQANGHVHVVLLRQGRSDADFNRFACTLVHEGTHAFLHRLHSSRLIPHWVNEGYAELMAERVLGDRCPAGENAALLAQSFVQHDWPIKDLLAEPGPIEVYQYALAHSIVSFLEEQGAKRLSSFIEQLKRGKTVSDALAAAFDGMTLSELEARWRGSFRVAKSPAPTDRVEKGPMFRVRREVDGVDYRNVSGSAEQLPVLEQNGQGIGLLDYDGDGWLDLFMPNGSTRDRWKNRKNPGNRLYRNQGGWRFEDVTERAGVRGNSWSNGVAIADYDADGDFDIYVLNWGPNTLYRNNGDGAFSDVTEASGVGETRWSSSAAFADFDGDAKLDIYVSNYVRFSYDAVPQVEKDGTPCVYRGVETGCGPWCYEGQRDTLYINRGDGRFADRSQSAGLSATSGFRGFGVVAADFDGDHDVDLYVGCDVMPNLYLENAGHGHFVSIGTTKGGILNHLGKHESGMGVAAVDFDGSGSLDLFTTNFAAEKNTFYRNRSGTLEDASKQVRIDGHRSEMGWGVVARDFNQDGLVDVFVANGHIYPQVVDLNDPEYRYAQPPRLYIQTKDGKLKEVKTGRAFGDGASWSLRGCAVGDLDNDGDEDLVAIQHNGPLVFFENRSNRGAVTVELIDRHGGRSPMGARITMNNGQTRQLLPNQGYQSSHDHRLHFASQGDVATLEIKVVWPNGSTDRYPIPQPYRGIVRLQQKDRSGG